MSDKENVDIYVQHAVPDPIEAELWWLNFGYVGLLSSVSTVLSFIPKTRTIGIIGLVLIYGIILSVRYWLSDAQTSYKVTTKECVIAATTGAGIPGLPYGFWLYLNLAVGDDTVFTMVTIALAAVVIVLIMIFFEK